MNKHYLVIVFFSLGLTTITTTKAMNVQAQSVKNGSFFGSCSNSLFGFISYFSSNANHEKKHTKIPDRQAKKRAYRKPKKIKFTCDKAQSALIRAKLAKLSEKAKKRTEQFQRKHELLEFNYILDKFNQILDTHKITDNSLARLMSEMSRKQLINETIDHLYLYRDMILKNKRRFSESLSTQEYPGLMNLFSITRMVKQLVKRERQDKFPLSLAELITINKFLATTYGILSQTHHEVLFDPANKKALNTLSPERICQIFKQYAICAGNATLHAELLEEKNISQYLQVIRKTFELNQIFDQLTQDVFLESFEENEDISFFSLSDIDSDTTSDTDLEEESDTTSQRFTGFSSTEEENEFGDSSYYDSILETDDETCLPEGSGLLPLNHFTAPVAPPAPAQHITYNAASITATDLLNITLNKVQPARGNNFPVDDDFVTSLKNSLEERRSYLVVSDSDDTSSDDDNEFLL